MAERRRCEDSGITDVPSSSSTGATGKAGSEQNVKTVINVFGDVIQGAAIGTLNKGKIINENQGLTSIVTGNNQLPAEAADSVEQIHGKDCEKQDNAVNPGVDSSRLIQVINDNTRQETASGIREDFKNEILHEPDFEVFPQMKNVNVDDYYKGRFCETKSSNIKAVHGFGREGFQSQLIEEVGFYRQSDNDSRPITMEEIMESVVNSEKLPPDDKVGYTAIVASAGSGKTTLMRRIAQKAVRIFSVKETGEPKPKMIHYIELKNKEEENGIKTSKFLFDGLFKNESEEDEAYELLDKNHTDATIIFDGLDQMKWGFEECSVRKITPYQKASSAIIMYNILSRQILRHVKIIVSSREFKVSELPAQARPEEIITLNGLTSEDAYKLFTCLLCENGKHLWEKIEIISPRLLQLVSVPVFLILIAVVMGIDPDRPPPSTVTELYSRILLVLQSVENMRNRKQILSIIQKLKAMAFEGMKDGRVVFYKADLDQFGVSADEVQDLMTKVPGNNILSRHLMEGDFTFFFCHQSMQEFLAASFISEMELEMFSRFDGQHLHEKRWSVVRRFVTGIVYIKFNNDLHSVSDQTQKQKVLSQSILSQLHDKTEFEDRYVRMELYTAIYESGDDNLMKDLSVINASGISLNRDKAHIVGSLAARNQSLCSLHLFNCSIDNELLSIIVRCLENRIRVKKVDLRHNKFSATELRSLLGHRRVESLSGKLDWEVVKLNVYGCYFELKNEEDVIKISGNRNEGHFDFKDCTLSFKMVVSVAAVKYVSDLFDAKSIKVKKVDLNGNKFSATELRSLLGHRRIESLSGKLDWEVVWLTVDGRHVELKNEEDVLTISGDGIEGHMKDSNLSFNRVIHVLQVAFLGLLFDAQFLKIDEQLLAKQEDLRKISDCKFEKISKILLDCTEEEENIDWSLIETCWKKYQLDLLDIAVNGLIPVQDYSRILVRRTTIPVFGNIHAMFYVDKADEFRKTLEACQQKKIEYIRCIFRKGCRPSLDEISSLVNDSNLKKLTLIYYKGDDMLKGNELKKVQKIANDLDTELEVLELHRETDAWRRLDWNFYLSQL